MHPFKKVADWIQCHDATVNALGERVAHDPSLIMLKGLQVLNGRSCKPSLLQKYKKILTES